MRGAFARSPVTRAVRNDISPAMEKWWKTVKKDDGQVSSHFLFSTLHNIVKILILWFTVMDTNLQITRHLSPYEVQAIMPWIKEWPTIFFKKVSTIGLWYGFAGAITLGTVQLTDAASDAAEFKNRY